MRGRTGALKDTTQPVLWEQGVFVQDIPLCLKYINTIKINYVLPTQLYVYFIIIILLLAISFGLKRPSSDQNLQKT
jgi:hypothetical protein